MAAEEVPAWQMKASDDASGSTWERKLMGLSSSISWGSVNQPAVILQRFFRSIIYLRKIREAVRYHANSPTSKRRLTLVQQLIDTEKRYVHALGLITEGFLRPLRKECSKSPALMPEGDLTLIFGNVEKIEHIHKEL